MTSVTIGSIWTDPLSTEVHWKIKPFSQLSPDTPYDYPYRSPNFLFQGVSWHLTLVPIRKNGYIMANLCIDSIFDGPKQTVKCHFGVKHSHLCIGSKEFSIEQTFPDEQYQIPLILISRYDLEKDKETLFPNGLFTFFCRLSVEGTSTTKEASTQTVVNSADNVLTTLGLNMKDLYMAKKHCDVTIKVKDETFAAHRAILGARTPVLEALFSHSMVEAETGVICVEDCDSKAFEVFLMFVYSGTVENLTSENVIPVYFIADKYHLPELKKECVCCMMSTLSIDTICNVISVAARHGEKVLMEGATKFFQENAQKIFLTPPWKTFMVENATQANELILSSFKYVTTKAASQCSGASRADAGPGEIFIEPLELINE